MERTVIERLIGGDGAKVCGDCRWELAQPRSDCGGNARSAHMRKTADAPPGTGRTDAGEGASAVEPRRRGYSPHLSQPLGYCTTIYADCCNEGVRGGEMPRSTR